MNDCAEPSRRNVKFGICDDQDGTKAYTTDLEPDGWIAQVLNPRRREVTFTAIDNCMSFQKPNASNEESTCDGMLTFEETLYLVELKDSRKKQWRTKSKEQLVNTIELLEKEDFLQNYRYKKAFLSNKKHRRFGVINKEENRRFFDTYGFRLDINTIIKI